MYDEEDSEENVDLNRLFNSFRKPCVVIFLVEEGRYRLLVNRVVKEDYKKTLKELYSEEMGTPNYIG